MAGNSVSTSVMATTKRGGDGSKTWKLKKDKNNQFKKGK